MSQVRQLKFLPVDWIGSCVSAFALFLLYLYHSSLVVGILLCLVGLKECASGNRILGPVWPLSEVLTRVGTLLFQSSPPHNLDMPSVSGYQNTHMQWLWRKSSLCSKQWMIYTDKDQIGCRSIQKNKASKIWEQAPWWRRRTKNIGKYLGCIMQSHDGYPYQEMVWPPISFTRFSDLVTRILADVTLHW